MSNDFFGSRVVGLRRGYVSRSAHGAEGQLRFLGIYRILVGLKSVKTIGLKLQGGTVQIFPTSNAAIQISLSETIDLILSL